jgi:putative membrane protein
VAVGLNGIRLAMQDIKHMWSSRILRKSVLGLMVLPLLYSFIYLWAFWNPTELVYRLPLAIVNQDQGIKQGGKMVYVGKTFADKLVNSEETNWKLVSQAEADRGIKTLDYFLVLTIPPDFSERAYSAGTANPRPAGLTYKINEGANMLGAKIVRTVMEKVEQQLQKELSTRYLQVIFDQIQNGGQGLKQAADGAAKLAAGTDSAVKGAASLQDGLQKSGAGIDKLADGVTQLSNGANQVENGLVQLNTVVSLAAGGAGQVGKQLDAVITKTNNLSTIVGDMGGAAEEAARRIQRNRVAVTDAVNAVNDTRNQIQKLRNDALGPLQERISAQEAQLRAAENVVLSLADKYPELNNDPLTGKALQAIRQSQAYRQQIQSDKQNVQSSLAALQNRLNDAAGTLADSQKQVEQNISQLGTNLTQFQGRINETARQIGRDIDKLFALPGQLQKLADGTKRLQEGSTRLVNGLTSLSKGMSDLRNGNTRLTEGATKLHDGLVQINQGQHQLAQRLGEAAGMAAQDGKADERIDVIADPVVTNEQNLHPVPNNGTGFAPYFISLSLWVGSLVLFFVIDLRTVPAMPKRPLSYMVNKYLQLASVSVLQSIISVFLLHTGLGLDTVLPPLQLYGFAIVIGLAYTAILFMLLAVLGNDVGRFVAVIILMLQLTSSSGSYPVELEPGFFQFIHPALPMTYAVEGLRHIISIGDHWIITRDMFVLIAYGIGSLFLLYVVKRKSILHEISERG